MITLVPFSFVCVEIGHTWKPSEDERGKRGLRYRSTGGSTGAKRWYMIEVMCGSCATPVMSVISEFMRGTKLC